MIYIYIIGSLILVFIFILFAKNIIVIPIIKRFNDIRSDFLNTFLADADHYYDNDEWLQWFNNHSFKTYNSKRLKFLLSKSKREIIDEYFKLINRKYIDEYNDHYVARKKIEFKDYFDKIEEFPFDQHQREAILHNEVNNLVIAGAGTGKTATLVGKVVFLIDKLKISPNRILLLAFTRKAVEEMEKRIESILNININIRTFDSIGYEILSKSIDKKKDIAFTDDNKKELYDFIQKIVEINLHNDDEFVKNVYKFFKYHINNNKPIVFKTDLRTINGEKVKSYQELMIANFLAVNNINYAYEKNYEIDTVTQEYRQYKPDFTYLIIYYILSILLLIELENPLLIGVKKKRVSTWKE